MSRFLPKTIIWIIVAILFLVFSGLLFYYNPVWTIVLVAVAAGLFTTLNTRNFNRLLLQTTKEGKDLVFSEEDVKNRLLAYSQVLQGKILESLPKPESVEPIVAIDQQQLSDDIKAVLQQAAGTADILETEVKQNVQLEHFRVTADDRNLPNWYKKLGGEFLWLRSPETIHAEEIICMPKYFIFTDVPPDRHIEQERTVKKAEPGKFLMLGFPADPAKSETGILLINLNKNAEIRQTDDWKALASYFTSHKVFDKYDYATKKNAPRILFYRHGLVKKEVEMNSAGQEIVFWKITRPIHIEFI